MTETIDADYRARIAAALTEAILVASMDGGRVPIIRTGEVVSALLLQIAWIAATSEATSTPTRKRKFCDDVARRLSKLIGEARQELSAGGSPITVVRELPPSGPLN